MKTLLQFSIISLPMKFMARVCMGAVWGISLSNFESDVRIGFGTFLAVVACLLSYSFVAWDRVPLSASRMALYGLLVAGEALAVGCVVLAALGAFTGQLETGAMVVCAFGGSFFTLYSNGVMFRDNMGNIAGSKS